MPEIQPEIMQWLGQATLTFDIKAENDDRAMEALYDHVEPILNEHCHITDRRVTFQQFIDPPQPDEQRVLQPIQANIFEPIEPDIHVPRCILESTINNALDRNYTKGVSAGLHNSLPNTNTAGAKAETPERVAILLQQFATAYDAHGANTEANVLRDAADLVDQLRSHT